MSSGWQVVGYPDDPIPDDPGVVATQIAHLRSVAANIATQVAALPQSGQVDALVWKSQDNDAPAQFRKMASQLPHDLDLLRTRYVKVADALDDFHPVLVHTKAQAQANLTVALAAHQDMQAAQAGVTQMNDFNDQAQAQAASHNQNLQPGQPPVQPAQWTGPDYPAILTDATIRYNNAKGQIDSAVNQFNNASQTAANRVNAASNDGLKNQSAGLFGFFKAIFVAPLEADWHGIELACHWVATRIPLAAISDVLGKITMILAVLSFFPVVGQVADVLSLITGGVMLACDTINAINDAYEHKFTWGGDGLGLALDVAGVALGGSGKLLERAVGGLGKTAEGFTKSADDLAAMTKADRIAKQGIRDESLARLSAAKSGIRGIGNRMLDFFGRGPLPGLRAGVHVAQDDLDAAVEVESRAADAASKAKVAMKPYLTTGKILQKSMKATVWATNVDLSGIGVTHSVSTMDDLPPAHGLLGNLKNVVVNSTVLDFDTMASYPSHASQKP